MLYVTERKKTSALSESQPLKSFFLYTNSISQLVEEKTVVRNSEKSSFCFLKQQHHKSVKAVPRELTWN